MTEDGSGRLRDRARSQFQRRRQQAASGASRLRDTAQTEFQRRRQQHQRTREAIGEGTSDFAGALELSEEDIRAVQLDDRGEQIGFVPDESGRSILGERFADERPFVEPGDALVDADPREGVQTMTDPAARARISERAARETAAEIEFIDGEDLSAEVGPGGVEDIMTRPDRRDDIAMRTASGLAADDPFADPEDFSVDVGPSGIERAGFTEIGERRRAGRQFADQTALEAVGPDEVQPTNGGFGLTDPAQRRLAAREFETEFEQFGRGDLDPTADVRPIDDGFGLASGPARQVAADRIDAELPNIDIGPDDITLEETPGGQFEASFEREVRR